MRLFTAAAFVVLCAAQMTAQPAPQQSRLMDLNVVAVDRNGTPVNDLNIDDLAISDAGKPEKIVFFKHLEVQQPDDSALPPRAPLPNEFSNRSITGTHHATVILFDLLNERMGTRANAWSQLVKYLAPLRNSDDLYLYLLTLDGRLFEVHGLSAPARNPGSPPWTRTIKPLMDRAMTTVTRLRPVDIDVAVRVQLTYAALLGLTGELGKVPGHKNIVWITDGVPMALGPRRSDTLDFVDFTPQLRHLSEFLHRCRVTIYPSRQIMLGSTDAPPDGPGGSSGMNRESSGTGSGASSDETLDEFARMTGGRPDAGRDIASTIKQAVIDSRNSYQFAYYPAPSNWDGKFHKIRITSSRKGIRFRAREGYYAWQESPESWAQTALDDAVSTTSDAAEIGLFATLSPDPNNPANALLKARIESKDIAFLRDAGQFAAHLKVAVVAYRADGQAQGSPLIPLDLKYNAQERDAAPPLFIDFNREVPVDPAVRLLRFFVIDLGSNTVGSLSVPTVNVSANQP